MNEPWKDFEEKPWAKYGNTGHDILPMDEETSYSLGALKGVADVALNVGRFGENLMSEDRFRARFGYRPPKTKSMDEYEQDFNKYLADKKREGVVPHNLTETGAEMLVTAPAFALGPVAGGAIMSGLTTEQRDPVGVVVDMAAGAAGGKIGDASMAYLAKKSKPLVDKTLNKLTDMKVDPTIGQQSGGIVRNLEEKLTSTPVLGNMINKRRGEAVNQWQRGVYNSVLDPIGKKLPNNLDDLGHGAFSYIKKELSDAYANTLKGAKFQADAPMWKGFENLVKLSSNARDPKNTKAFQEIMQERILPAFSNGGKMTGQAWKKLDSYLAEKARSFKKSPSGDDREFVSGINEMRRLLKEALMRSNSGTDIGRRLANIDLAYAKRSVVKKAVDKSNESGTFSPQQLMTSVRQNSSGDRFATGNALMQGEAQAGKHLVSKTPNSASADRYMLGAGFLGGAESMAYGAPILTASSLGIPSLAYTRSGQKVLKGMFGKSMTKHKLLEASRKPAGFLSAHLGPNLLPDF